MVKLGAKTSTELGDREKAPPHQVEPLLDSSVEVPLKRETIVHMQTGRPQRKHVVGLIIAAFIILAIGGAIVACLHFSGHFGTGYTDQQEHDYRDRHREGHGGDRGRQSDHHDHQSDDRGRQSGKRRGSDEPDKDRGGSEGGRDPNRSGRGDKDGRGGRRGGSKAELRARPIDRIDEVNSIGHHGRLSSKGVFGLSGQGQPRRKHHLPLP